MSSTIDKAKELGLKLLLCGMVIVLVYSLGKYIYNWTQSGPFNSHLTEYGQTMSKALSGYYSSNERYVKGKVIVVEIEGDSVLNAVKVDSAQLDLPVELRAMKPEEVNTIVGIRWKSVGTGYRRRSGYQESVRACDLIVIDKANSEVSGRESFQVGSNYFGFIYDYSHLRSEVVNYLNNLPHK